MKPSKVAEFLGIDLDKAQVVTGLMSGRIDPLSYPSAAAYNRKCYHAPEPELLALYAIDEVLGTFGVEGFCDEAGRKEIGRAHV